MYFPCKNGLKILIFSGGCAPPPRCFGATPWPLNALKCRDSQPVAPARPSGGADRPDHVWPKPELWPGLRHNYSNDRLGTNLNSEYKCELTTYELVHVN
jgi:hypothetical protein